MPLVDGAVTERFAGVDGTDSVGVDVGIGVVVDVELDDWAGVAGIAGMAVEILGLAGIAGTAGMAIVIGWDAEAGWKGKEGLAGMAGMAGATLGIAGIAGIAGMPLTENSFNF